MKQRLAKTQLVKRLHLYQKKNEKHDRSISDAHREMPAGADGCNADLLQEREKCLSPVEALRSIGTLNESEAEKLRRKYLR
jgi:hypothetical protein